MTWYTWAIISGIVYPWTIAYDRREMLDGFRRYGAQGIGVWIGKSIAVTAVLLILFWIAHKVFE